MEMRQREKIRRALEGRSVSPLPTRDEIEAAAAAIQLGWSRKVRNKRLVAEPHWDPPFIVLRIEEEEDTDVTCD